MAYDVARIRSLFPSLESGWAHFDGPGGTQTPRPVGDAVASVLTGPLSNRGTIGESEERAEAAVHGFRLAMADLLDAHPRGIVHGRSATQLVYDFSRHLSREWRDRATRSSSPGSTTTRTCGRGCRRPSAPARPCAGPTSTPRPASSRRMP